MRVGRLVLLAVPAALAAVLAAPVAVAAGEGGLRVIEARDRCEPVSFNTALGEELCATEGGRTEWGRFGPGDVIFEEFLEELNPKDFGHGAWKFSREETHIDHDEALLFVNLGGEPHSLTPVQRFGAGCVPELNEPLGLHEPGIPAHQCPAAFASLVPPGQSRLITGLEPGTHRFICALHPWMRATVEVRG